LIHINVPTQLKMASFVEAAPFEEGLKMNRITLGCLSEQHLLLFGAIIQWFARYELLIQELMATVLGAEPASVMLLTRNLDFSDKRLALLDLLRHWHLRLDRFERISEYLMIPHNLMPLWKDIIHSVWMSGVSSSWIQPDWILRPAARVKPLHDDPAALSAKFVERDQDKVAYTLDDLNQIVQALAANHERFSEYFHDVGLVPSRQTVSIT
jgi:hypothetical protein